MPRRTRGSGSGYSLIGWREWVGLPDLGIDRIRAKTDTGAATSSMHATRIHEFEKDGEKWVRFSVNPTGRKGGVKRVELPLYEKRLVRSSNGQTEVRPVVRTRVRVLNRRFRIQITLTHRGNMAFPMLLGREALRDRFVIDPSHSYLSDFIAPTAG